MGKLEGIGLVPLIMVALVALLLFLPRIDPLRKNYAAFRDWYDGFILAFVLFMLAGPVPDHICCIVSEWCFFAFPGGFTANPPPPQPIARHPPAGYTPAFMPVPARVRRGGCRPTPSPMRWGGSAGFFPG